MADFREESEAAAGVDPASPPPGEASVVDEMRGMVEAARRMALAELAYQSARARLMGKAAAWCAAFGALGLALLFFVLMALVVGLLLALAPILGAWRALGAVVGGLLVATLIAALVSWLSLRRFLALLRDGKRES